MSTICKYSLIFSLIFVLCSCNNSLKKYNKSDNTAKDLTSLEFLNCKKYEFGRVVNGTIIKKKFTFRNIGDKPLIMKNYRVSCNCTDIKFSKKIINPKDTANIELKLDTKHKHNFVNIYCVLIFNTKQKYYKVSMNGSVIKKK